VREGTLIRSLTFVSGMVAGSLVRLRLAVVPNRGRCDTFGVEFVSAMDRGQSDSGPVRTA